MDDRKENSIEDKQFLDKITKSKTFVDGQYEFCLPFRGQSPVLPNNECVATMRLESLKRKMLVNQQFCEDYKLFMDMLLQKGYAEEVPADELNRCDGKTWYLPHHGVYHATKNKLRVVFDCSSRYKGISLNDTLLQGPDLTNNLIGVLLRFRTDHVAVMGDIAKMFYQVKVAKSDRDCLRFFWWPKGNLEAKPLIYRMTVHIFGAISSPSCSSFALQQTIQDNRDKFPPAICQKALTSFYVDDFLSSVSNDSEAIVLVKEVTSLCHYGGFHLTKWATNSKDVLASIPDSDKATDFIDLDLDKFPVERALGVIWDIETDTLGYHIKPKTGDVTRRTVLSVISSIYDPHGLIAPFILPGRIILQNLCRKGMQWDHVLSSTELDSWHQWADNLSQLENVKVQRCLKPPQNEEIDSIQLHHFSDASDSAYGTVTYVRFVYKSGWIHCSLLMGKARVAPLKKISIPRMELTAATLAVKINNIINTELQYKVHDIFFWTDSMTVIKYVANETTRFQTFVANRLAIIHEGSDPKQWHFIEGKSNPADVASRGLKFGDSEQAKLWFDGPEFLWRPESEWPKNPDTSSACSSLQTQEPEIKVQVCMSTTTENSHFINRLVNNVSDWMKIRRILGWILFYVKRLQAKAGKSSKLSVKHENDTQNILPVHILQKAEEVLIQHIQSQFYANEIKTLQDDSKEGVRKSSSLYKLDPFIENGIIRVGGRLSRSSLEYDAKHQILIPRESPIAHILLKHIHKTVAHQGINTMLARLREKYWIPKATRLVKQITSKCVDCRKYSAKTCVQKMADLPEHRVISDKPPFWHTGMDYFGPFYVRRGRMSVKRYGVIFTCFTSRAVHLEVAFTLDTDSCINAIRRFLARRGNIEMITSDNGTNLVGAEHELSSSLQQWNLSKIGNTLQQHNIKWSFNPPTGSHFGGIWERIIRSVRKILHHLLQEQMTSLDDELLQTLMCEVEFILNSRPISAGSDNPRDLEALTPNHLLLIGPNQGLPPGIFCSADNYSRRRWRQIQYLSNVFWKRWVREYLPLLQERQKWLRRQRNLAVGDIVLLVDKMPRNTWLMGRVINIHKDAKGLVRVVTVMTKTSTLQRPVDKLCLILEADEA